MVEDNICYRSVSNLKITAIIKLSTIFRIEYNRMFIISVQKKIVCIKKMCVTLAYDIIKGLSVCLCVIESRNYCLTL